jgi:hypothetical protein
MTNEMIPVLMQIEGECSVVLLSADELRQYRDEPDGFEIYAGNVTETCGTVHESNSAASKRCFRKWCDSRPFGV